MDFAAEKAHDATTKVMASIMTRSRGQRVESDATASAQPFMGTRQVVASPIPDSRDDPSPFGGDSQLIGPHANIGFAGFARRFPSENDNNNAATTTTQLQHYGSDPKLYQGNAWELMYFQRIMVLSLMRLLIFIRKIYEDLQTTKLYGKTGNFGFFVVSSIVMLAPTIVFTLYRICRFLQQALPKLRSNKQQQGRKQHRARHADALEMRRATPSGGPMESEGLVTACQSPSPVSSQYVDCPASNNIATQSSICTKISSTQSLPTTMSTKVIKYPRLSPVKLERMQHHQQIAKRRANAASGDEQLATRVVDVSKLGDLPDPESTRIVLGAGEQIVHGVLYVFWQLKRQVDVIGYLVERSCLWRKASQEEMREVELLRTGSDGLEWFQDFYAAFIAIILQVYSLGAHWLHGANKQDSASVAALGDAANKIGDTSKVGEAARGVLLNSHLLSETNEDFVIMSEIIISSVAIFSLLIAVRRKDDGSVTLVLSMLGWGCSFAARIIIIALSFVHLGWKVMLSVISFHLALVTCWVYKISIDSHNDKPSETEAFIWQEGPPTTGEDEDQLESGRSRSNTTEGGTSHTDSWLPIEHLTLVTQIFTLFAIPSLFYWPIMFNLRKNYRTPMYLLLILSENFLLIAAVFITIGRSLVTTGQLYLLMAASAATIVGFVFISLYLLCKPALTDYMVRADQLFNGAERAGIYFELCSRVFKMPDLSSHNFSRLRNQTEEQVEV